MNFKISYVEGQTYTIANALSRLPTGSNNDNQRDRFGLINNIKKSCVNIHWEKIKTEGYQNYKEIAELITNGWIWKSNDSIIQQFGKKKYQLPIIDGIGRMSDCTKGILQL
ncbi:hypothetical protein RF11_05760 [Thelohanellus kitauei]|uniref:Uncharacterized protein n=1 Tax=Thelohanellus kitauei TaxID=669202 RepID=A0A0C2JB28_THEKT|nr:hypothetical protein RF11_05760 [Thelohanellus kitauei]